MVSTMKCVLTVAIIASVACSAYALQCYNCDSTRDAKCGEKFEKEDRFKTDCALLAPLRTQFGGIFNRNATGCMKRLFDHTPGQPRIERTCFFGDIAHQAIGCQPDITQIGINTQRVLSCDVCTDKLCNGSNAIAPVGLAIVLFFALARLFA